VLTLAAVAVAAVAHVVHVDVIASDRHGRLVDTLKPADFVVSEEGQPQPVEQAQFVRIDAKPGAADPIRPIASEQDEQEAAAHADARLFAIFLDDFHVTSGDGAQRVRESLLRFLDEQAGPHDLFAVMRPLDSLLAIRCTHDLGAVRAAISAFQGRRGDYTPKTEFEAKFMGRSRDVIERQRAQITVSALNALAIHLGSLKVGRKAIVLVSEGFSRPSASRGMGMLPTVQSLVRVANRYNVSIYPLNPGGEPNDVLQTVADGTEGQAFEGSQDFDGAMTSIVRDTSGYYLLTLRSSAPEDGKFHALTVSVKRPGIQLRARKGFWAPVPDEEIHPLRALSAPVIDLTPRHTSPLIRPWFGESRGADGRTRIMFVWEPIERTPGDRSRVPEASRVSVRATLPDGTLAFEGVVEPTGPGLEVSDPNAAKAVFDAPAGRVRLQMSITGPNAKELDVDTRDLPVRPIADLELATPQVLRARTAAEYRALAANPDAAPVSSRVFSRTERLLIRFTAYGSESGAPSTAARLLSRTGQPMRLLPIARIGSVGQVDLPLAGFAPGEYVVEVTATSGGRSTKEQVTIRVTS